MKKIKLFLLLSCLCLVLTGCSKKTKDDIDMKNVNEVLYNAGYTVYDISSKYAFASTAYMVDQDDIDITVLQADNIVDVQGIYVDEAKNVFSSVEDDYDKSITGGDNWNCMKVIDSKNIYYVGYVNDAYITLKAPIKYKSKMLDMIEELGF